ncbi:MAG TPA: DUF4184 family protein [Steroidobacteraceae bacterium]|nr:DUF4184 family protein [Steroidobacteraceae bacterium]
MPYTVSHVAAVMPGYQLLSRAHVFSAAVIGSMVPDFGLLLPRDPARVETHSLMALFTFCLPVGLVAYWLTQLLIKPALLEALPDGPYLRLRGSHPAASLVHIKTWFTASGAILFGAFTHILWDEFTHEDTRAGRVFPFLKDYSPDLHGHPVALWRWLQLGSSAVGLTVVLIALGVWIYHARREQVPHTPRRIPADERLMWLCLYLVPPLVAVSWAFWRAYSTGASAFEGTPGYGLGSVAVASVRGAVVSLLFISALLKIRSART